MMSDVEREIIDTDWDYQPKITKRECEQCHKVVLIKGNLTKCIDCRHERKPIKRHYRDLSEINLTGNPEQPR